MAQTAGIANTLQSVCVRSICPSKKINQKAINVVHATVSSSHNKTLKEGFR